VPIELAPFLTVAEVALMIRQSKQTVCRHIREERLIAYRLGRGSWRIQPEDVRQFLEDSKSSK